MFSRLRFHSNDGDLHLRFDGLSRRFGGEKICGTHETAGGASVFRFAPFFLCVCVCVGRVLYEFIWRKLGWMWEIFRGPTGMFQDIFVEQDDLIKQVS